MSKKLIAVAAAAALALSALIAAPATGAVGAFGVVTTGSISTNDGTTGDLEFTINVPSQDVQRLDVDTINASTTGTLLRHVVTTPTVGAAVSVAAAGGGAKLISAAQHAVLSTLTSTSGTATLALTSDTGGNVTFYSYTTSTADSTITASSAGASVVRYMKGVSPKTNSYKLNFAVSPLSSAAGGDLTFTGTITDAFGNLMKSVVGADLTVTGLGGDLATIAKVDYSQNATTSVITFDGVNRSTVGAAAINVVMANTLAPTAGEPTKITAFGTPVGTQFFSVNAVDLSAQITALTAQVAALSAQLANSRSVENSVTKKKYNSLARKWNASNPSARVALKK